MIVIVDGTHSVGYEKKAAATTTQTPLRSTHTQIQMKSDNVSKFKNNVAQRIDVFSVFA